MRLDLAGAEEAPEGRLGLAGLTGSPLALDDGLAVGAIAGVRIELADHPDAAVARRRGAAPDPRSRRASRGPARSMTSNMASTTATASSSSRVEHRVQRAVRLDVVEPRGHAGAGTPRARPTGRRAYGMEVLRRDRHDAPAEAEQVRQPRMRADRHAVLDGRATARRIVSGSPPWKPQARLAVVIARQQRVVSTELPVAERLAEIAVDVHRLMRDAGSDADRCRPRSAGARSAAPPRR